MENQNECNCVCCTCELTEENTHYEHGPASPCQHCVYLTDGHHCNNNHDIENIEDMNNTELETILRKHIQSGNENVSERDLYLDRSEIIQIIHEYNLV